VECKGDPAKLTVIFEAGLSQYTAHSTYGKAQDLIAPFAHVCIYDRAGLGWSDAAAGKRSHEDMVTDLHKLLEAKELTPPIILVGHSFEGLLARLYAQRYPDEVAAIVLADASSEEISFGPGSAEGRTGAIAQIDRALVGASEGVPVTALPAETPAEAMMAFTPTILRSVKQEYESFDLVPEAMREANGYGKLGDKPLAVIRRGRTSNPPSELDKLWQTQQEAMTSLSTQSFLVVAEQSGHVIPYDQPELVAQTVQRIIGDLSNE
jgi:pimeloyl-ACP methyl ester carboxylesterase